MDHLQYILGKMEIQYSQNQPFVVYCKPGNKNAVGIFQKNNKIYLAESFEEKGFVFAPFDGIDYMLIPENESEIVVGDLISDEIQFGTMQLEENPEAKTAFESLTRKGIDAIGKGQFGKVVLSRKEIVDIPGFDLASVFSNLLSAYPNAFRYCWFHPKTGLWLGATPERLLKVAGRQFNTVALAGTQKNMDSENVVWQEKEKKEQQIVTDFISGSLKNSVSEMTLSKPYTAKAGNLLHIKTDIAGTLNGDGRLRQIVEILHPTPAVCGLPKAEAKKFILENEGYDREFYSGFFGELNKDFTNGEISTDLYVNLRCMKIRDNEAQVFVGCGITNDSIPEMEFLETVNKSMTMKKILP